MRRSTYAALGTVFALARQSSADITPDPSYSALPCRPTIACTADFVPPGVMELESGYIYRRLGSGANQSSIPFLLKRTVLEWVQLQIQPVRAHLHGVELAPAAYASIRES
jgi:hypothetical protein